MKQIGQLIREIIPVILGILIALVINNWNEERKNRNYLDKIFLSIQAELIESDKILKEVLPQQQSLIDSVEYYLKDEEINLFEITKKAGGLRTRSMNLTSWKALARSKIELIEFEKISRLAELERWNESLDSKSEKVGNFLYDNFKETSQEKKEVYKMLIQEIIYGETYIRRKIEKFLEK